MHVVVVAVVVVVVAVVVVVVAVLVVAVIVVAVVVVVVVEFSPHSQEPSGHSDPTNAKQAPSFFLLHGPLPTLHPLQRIPSLVVVIVEVVVVLGTRQSTRPVAHFPVPNPCPVS